MIVKNLTKTEQVRRYATKHPFMTVRQMASDLDMSPASVHQIMWNLRKKGKLSSPKTTAPKVQVETKTEDTVVVSNEVIEELQVAARRLEDAVRVLIKKRSEDRVVIKYLERRLDEVTHGKETDGTGTRD